MSGHIFLVCNSHAVSLRHFKNNKTAAFLTPSFFCTLETMRGLWRLWFLFLVPLLISLVLRFQNFLSQKRIARCLHYSMRNNEFQLTQYEDWTEKIKYWNETIDQNNQSCSSLKYGYCWNRKSKDKAELSVKSHCPVPGSVSHSPSDTWEV